MQVHRQQFLKHGLVLAMGVLVAASCAWAADGLPAGKTVRIIVPYAPGGTSDILGRKLAQGLQEKLGHTVIVENKAGAGGAIGTEATVRGEADGTVILLHSGAISTEPALKAKLPYDVTRDLLPVANVVSGPFALLVSNATPAKSVKELVAYAKANPGKVNFGTPGPGTSVHLASEQFKVAAGIPMAHVPYKGAGPALQALMGDEVQVVIDPLSTAKKYAESGKLRALALTTAKRSELWPGMGTVAEGGVAGYDTAVWYGAYVPAKTPAATVSLLNKAVGDVLKTPEMTQWLKEQGLESAWNTPQQAKQFLLNDIARWKKVASAAGIKPE